MFFGVDLLSVFRFVARENELDCYRFDTWGSTGEGFHVNPTHGTRNDSSSSEKKFDNFQLSYVAPLALMCTSYFMETTAIAKFQNIDKVLCTSVMEVQLMMLLCKRGQQLEHAALGWPRPSSGWFVSCADPSSTEDWTN